MPPHRPPALHRLSRDFRLAEFDCRDGTRVPEAAIPALTRLVVTVLQPLRLRFGPCEVVSGYRHEAYNRKIGGARRSHHIYDIHPTAPAADVRFRMGTSEQWADAAEELRPGGLGLYATWIHVDLRNGRARWTV